MISKEHLKLNSNVADIVPDTEDGITVKYNLASMYAQGIGCKKDLIKAASLYKDCVGSGDDAEKCVLKCFLNYVIDNLDKEMFEFSANINKFTSVIFNEESEISYVIRESMDYFYATNREKIADK